MITATTHPRHPAPASWQTELAAAYTSPEALADALGLDPNTLGCGPVRARAADPTAATQAPPDSPRPDTGPTSSPTFRMLVPASYVRRMRRGDPHDPLLLQVLPSDQENEDFAGFTADPVGER